MNNLGHGCANDGLWHPCLFIPSCPSPLPAFRLHWQNSSCSNSVTLIRQRFWICKMPSFPSKKNLKSFYLKLFSWRISQPFPPKQLYGQSHRAIVLQLTGRGMEWDAEITLTVIATRDRTLQSHSLTFCSEPQPYFLLLAWPRLKAGLWESYLPSLRLSISVSYSVK